MPDAAVVEAARAGDADALDTLVGAYLPLVYNIVGRALGRPVEIDDVVQDVMLQMVRDLRQLRDPGAWPDMPEYTATYKTAYANFNNGQPASLFSSYDQGNQIAKTAATQATVPAGSGLLSLDEDGTACSADYYLRLTNDGGRMLKGQIAVTAVRPTLPVGSTSSPTPTPPPTASATTPAPITSATATATVAGCGMLTANQKIAVGQSMLSCDGRFKLVLGGNGNLVLYQGAAALWAANTGGKGSADAIMQGDGNFVIYNSKGKPVWASGTAGHAGASLSAQDDGNVVIYGSGGGALWSTRTAGH